jgi:hypothetical protein
MLNNKKGAPNEFYFVKMVKIDEFIVSELK